MENLYGKAVALAVPVFLFLIALELILNRARRTRCYNLADSINSLSCGMVSTGVRVFVLRLSRNLLLPVDLRALGAGALARRQLGRVDLRVRLLRSLLLLEPP